MTSNYSQTEYERLMSNPSEFQEILDKQRLLCFTKNIIITNLAEIINFIFFNKLTTNYADNSIFQCAAQRARSIDDTYLVCKHYNIDATFEQVRNAVEFFYKYRRKNDQGTVLGYYFLAKSFCSTVHKRVHSAVVAASLEELTKILEENNMNYGIKSKSFEITELEEEIIVDFSTKEKAEEYIIYNKPIISLNDVLRVGSYVNGQGEDRTPFERLRTLAKSKLNL